MDIQVWADFSCPYCLIGHQHLKAALKDLGLVVSKLSIRSFLLDPDGAGRPAIPVLQRLQQAYGLDEAEARKANAKSEGKARAAGLSIDMSGAWNADTRPAHLLLQLAREHGLDAAFFHQVQLAMMVDKLIISDQDLLLNIAQGLGIPREQAVLAWKDSKYQAALQADLDGAYQIHFDYVPYFLVDGHYSFQGDLSLEEVKHHLIKSQAKEEKQP